MRVHSSRHSSAQNGLLVDKRTKLRAYWALIKSLQTALLLITGLAGFMSSRCPFLNIEMLIAVGGSLFLSISGSTVLNMWYDRDLDARMERTCWRPLPAGQIKPPQALVFGVILSIAGIGWALSLNALYGLIVFAGLFFDVVIYTFWLKRRTAWSILWGGISGGMPVLAGRTMGTGEIEWVGILLALAVLFWIPTHILTYNMRYFDDYARAGVPTFPSVHGFKVTRKIIAISSAIAAISMGVASIGVGMTIGYLRLIIVLSTGLLLLAGRVVIKPTERLNYGLFKYASLYMLSTMLLLAAEVF